MQNAYIKKCPLMTITPKRRAPSSEFEESCDSSSPVKACNYGSMHTLGQTSVIS